MVETWKYREREQVFTISQTQSRGPHPMRNQIAGSPPHRYRTACVWHRWEGDRNRCADWPECSMACGQWGMLDCWRQPSREPGRNHPAECRICLE